MKVRDVLILLKSDGWYLVATEAATASSTFEEGRVTVAGKPSDEIPPGTLNSILKQQV